MSGGSLTTKGIVGGGGLGATYRMRARDTTLNRFVYWNYPAPDSTGAGYTGPGPLTDIVVSIIIGQPK